MRILVADDDPQLVRALRVTLAARGYEVIAASDGAAAVALAAQSPPDLVLLDLGMPHLDGVEVIQALRGWTTAPIIVVSGRTGSADKIDELFARIRALVRRIGTPENAPAVSFGDVVVDLSAKAVFRSGERVHVTPTEWRMLEFLARNPGALVTRQTLLKEIWGSEQVADSGYLRLYVSQLRKKLEADPSRPRHLLTESGMGYRLVIAPDDA